MVWTILIATALAQPGRPEFVTVCDKQLMGLLMWTPEDGLQWLPGEPDAAVAREMATALRMEAHPIRHPAFRYSMRVSSFAHTWNTYRRVNCRPDDVHVSSHRPELMEALDAWQAGSVPGQTWIAQDTPIYSAALGGEAVAFLLRGEKVHVSRAEPSRLKVAANPGGQVVQGWAPIELLVADEPAGHREPMAQPEAGETWIAACEYDRATLVGRWTAQGGLEPVGGEGWPEARLHALGRALARERWTVHSARDGQSRPAAFPAPGVVRVNQTKMLDLGRCSQSGIVTSGASLAATPLSSVPSILVDLTEKRDFYLPYPTRQQCGSVALREQEGMRVLTETGCEPSWTEFESEDSGLVSFIESRDGTTWTAVISEVSAGKLESSIRVDIRWVPGCN
jgi:hypothetical protein